MESANQTVHLCVRERECKTSEVGAWGECEARRELCTLQRTVTADATKAAKPKIVYGWLRRERPEYEDKMFQAAPRGKRNARGDGHNQDTDVAGDGMTQIRRHRSGT